MKLFFSRWGQGIACFFLLCGGSAVFAGPVQLISQRDFSQNAPAGGSGDSGTPIISPDGRYVLFASSANNLVLPGAAYIPAGTRARLNVYLRDRTGGTTTLVSMNLTGTAGGNGDSLPDGISPDGRYVIFESTASDLVAGDTNNATDVFVRDLIAGTTTLVSVNQSGGSGNGASSSAAMTPDGRYIAFTSAATNLVANDTNGIPDIFVRDVLLGNTSLVSVGAIASAAAFPPSSSAYPQISADGNYVAFFSTASNLVVGGTNTVGDIYVRALNTATTYWASTNARAQVLAIFGKTNAVSYNQQLSTNGNYIAYEANFPGNKSAVVLRYNLLTGLTDVVHTNAASALANYESAAHNLDLTPEGRFVAFVANTNSSGTCICRWDAQTGANILVSSNRNGGVTSGSFADAPEMDASGQVIAFLSNDASLTTNSGGGFDLYVRNMIAGTIRELDAAVSGPPVGVDPEAVLAMSGNGQVVAFEERFDGNLVADDRNRAEDIFARVLSSPTNELISVHDPALPVLTPDAASVLKSASVSSNGLYVAFASEADNLVPNDTNGWRDVFVRDVARGTNVLASVATNGISPGNAASFEPSLSANGRYVAFTSMATNLVSGDSNKVRDVFVRDLLTGTNDLVSSGVVARSFGNGASRLPTISADGRFVLYSSLASNLAAGTFSAGTENLYLRDRQLRTNYALTFAGWVYAAMTPDGHYIAFKGSLSASVSGIYLWNSQTAARSFTNAADTSSSISSMAISSNGLWLAYIASAAAVNLRLVNVAANTAINVSLGTFPGLSRPGFSADGRYLVYATYAKNDASDLNGLSDVYVYDRQTGTNQLITHGFTGGAANGVGDVPLISPDGRFVAYRSFASNNISGDANGLSDLFLYDRMTAATTLVTAGQNSSLAADERSLPVLFSSDSQTLFFQSFASDLIAYDFNQSADIFACNLPATVDMGISNLLSGFSGELVSTGGSGTSGGDGSGPALVWPVVPGKTYTVQYKDSLSDPVWQILNGSVTVIGTNGYAFDLAPASDRRFYRIVLSN